MAPIDILLSNTAIWHSLFAKGLLEVHRPVHLLATLNLRLPEVKTNLKLSLETQSLKTKNKKVIKNV